MPAKTKKAAALDPAFLYLNKLRRSGATNMYGAAPYLQSRFGYDRAEAKAKLHAWMEWAESNPANLDL